MMIYNNNNILSPCRKEGAGAKRAFITNQGGCGGKNALTKAPFRMPSRKRDGCFGFLKATLRCERERQLSWVEALNKRLDFLQPQLDEKA